MRRPQRTVVAAVAALMLVFVAACSGGAKTADPPSPSPFHTSLYFSPGNRSLSMVWGGKTRSYVVQVPSDLPANTPVPLVVALHGYEGYALHFENDTHLNYYSQLDKMVVIYPNGLEHSWNGGTCCGWAAAHDVDDVGFISALITLARESINIDPKRIYLIGFSNGGMLAYRFLCQRPDEISGIAVGSSTDTWTSKDGKTSYCDPITVGNVISMNGLADPLVPYNGGYNRKLNVHFLPPRVSLGLVTTDDCQGAEPGFGTGTFGDVKVKVIDATACKGGAERLITSSTLGHMWTRNVKLYGIDETTAALNWLFVHPKQTEPD